METRRVYSLGQSPSAFAVDRESRVIKGISLCSTGEAIGHWVWADSDFVKEVVRLGGEAEDGIKVRFGHPGWVVDGIGSEIGVIKNISFVESKKLTAERGYPVAFAVGDFHAFEPSKKNADAIDHLFSMAEQAPSHVGFSIVFWSDGFKTDDEGREIIDNPKKLPHDTIKILSACDIVSDPALNPDGMFPKVFSSVVDRFDAAISRLVSLAQSKLSSLSTLSVTDDMSKTANTPAALSDYRGQRAALERKGKKGFGEGSDADGQMLRWPGDDPELGDPLMVVDAEGVETPAGAGEYVVAGDGVTWTLVTDADGYITSVTQAVSAGAAGGDDAGAAAELSAAKRAAAEAQKRATEAEAEAAKLRAEAEKREADAAKLRSAKEHKPEFVDTTPKMDKRQVYQVGGATEKSEVSETLRLVLDNKRAQRSAINRKDHAELQRLIEEAPKFRATGTGWDIQSPGPPDLLERCPDFEDVLREEIINEAAQEYFTVKQYDVRGSSSHNVALPVLSDVSGGTYLKPGFPCDPEFEGNSKLVARELTLVPFHYARKYCVRDEAWGNLFNGKYFVNNQEIPLQAMLLEQLVSSLMEEMNLTVMFGTSGPNIMDGIITQAIADVSVPKLAYTVEYNAPTATDNPYTYTLALDALIPQKMRQRASREQLQWILAEPQYRAYIAWVQQNNQFQVPLQSAVNVQPPTTVNARWYPSFLMTDTLTPLVSPQDMFQLITFKTNLILGLSSLERDGERLLEFRPFEGDLRFLFNKHIGATYAQSSMMVLGTPTLAP